MCHFRYILCVQMAAHVQSPQPSIRRMIMLPQHSRNLALELVRVTEAALPSRPAPLSPGGEKGR